MTQEKISWYEDQNPEIAGWDDEDDPDMEYDCIFPDNPKCTKCAFRQTCFHPNTWEGLREDEKE